MYAVDVKNVSKSYGNRIIVDNVSFIISDNEILGMIGPNGAGKTTNIRMIMGVIKPDFGEVFIFGKKFSSEANNIIGYLPEERGLYRKKSILDSMTYLASLKGMSGSRARSTAEELLTRVNMHSIKNKKIEELSHGMGQIIQFLVTIIHDPPIIILDEPFNGLDPVNIKMVKDMIIELKSRGKAIMLSTHRMNEVEELCDRIFMIDKGKNVLYGSLTDIKNKYRNNSVLVEYNGSISGIDDIQSRRINDNTLELFLEGSLTPRHILERLVSQKADISRFEVSTPALNEIFIRVVGKSNE